MDLDQKPVARPRDLNTNFVDDDDLQAALARSRKAKIHKAQKLSPEELAKKSTCSWASYKSIFFLILLQCSRESTCPGRSRGRDQGGRE